MKKYLIYISIIFLFTGCFYNNKNLTFEIQNKEEQIYSTKKAKEISMEQLIDEIKEYQVIFVGDHHNNALTHTFLNKILKNLTKQQYNIHLANEWFTPEHNLLLLDYTNNKIDSKTLKKKRQWSKFTKYDWKLVEQLYKTVRKSEGKLYGINLTKEEREKISLKKINEMTKSELSFFNSLDLDINSHKNFVSPYFKHCNKMPIKSSEPCEDRMYRVQVAWDTYMAKQTNILSRKVLKNKKDILIVFAGAMHIEKKLGIPLRFSRLNNTPYISISNYKIEKDKDILIPINKADILYLYE